MPPVVALCLCGCLVIGLFWIDRKSWAPSSGALWIPLLWLVIIGSRPLTTWLGGGGAATADGELEGSPLDRLIFMGLIGCGLVVLASRRIQWSTVLGRNKLLCALYLYLAASVLWSDYPFVSFKRWTKDLGMVVMVLVVLTDRNPTAAVRAVLARSAYLLIPLSVVLIKYYPTVGRTYSRWTGEASYGGATTNKNELGMVLFTSALALSWMWIHRKALRTPAARRTSWLPFLLLAPMILWLFRRAHSATALVSAAIGVAVLVGLQSQAVRSRMSSLGLYVALGVLGIALLQSTVDLRLLVLDVVGRDVTFTGRTEIWTRVLSEPINPIVGEGFYSFWLGDRNARVSDAFDYLLGTAHNAYIEVYLNSGLIGLGLLFVLMARAFQESKRMVVHGLPLGDLRLALFLGAATYAMTEAVFNRLGVVWFSALLAMVNPSVLTGSARLPTRRSLGRDHMAPTPAGIVSPPPDASGEGLRGA